MIKVLEVTKLVQNDVIDRFNILRNQPQIERDDAGLATTAPFGFHFSNFQTGRHLQAEAFNQGRQSLIKNEVCLGAIPILKAFLNLSRIIRRGAN